jgi:hypothetical protein
MIDLNLENLLMKHPLREFLGNFSFASVKTLNPSPGFYSSLGHFESIPNTGKRFKKGFENFSRREVQEEYLENLKVLYFNLRFLPPGEEVFINTKMDYMLYRTSYPVQKIKHNFFIAGGGRSIFPICAVSNSKKDLDDYFKNPEPLFAGSYVLINGIFKKKDYL